MPEDWLLGWSQSQSATSSEPRGGDRIFGSLLSAAINERPYFTRQQPPTGHPFPHFHSGGLTLRDKMQLKAYEFSSSNDVGPFCRGDRESGLVGTRMETERKGRIDGLCSPVHAIREIGCGHGKVRYLVIGRLMKISLLRHAGR